MAEPEMLDHGFGRLESVATANLSESDLLRQRRASVLVQHRRVALAPQRVAPRSRTRINRRDHARPAAFTCTFGEQAPALVSGRPRRAFIAVFASPFDKP